MRRLWYIIPLLILFAGMASIPPLSPGMPARDFMLYDLSGEKEIRLSELKGNLIILNFWATWCKPCTKEMPEMEAGYRKYKDKGLMVIGVNLGEGKKRVKEFADKYGLTFYILLDKRGTVASTYGITSLPVTFIIGRDGIIKERTAGGITDNYFTEKIKELFY